MTVADVDFSGFADGAVVLFKQLGWERGIFFMLVVFLEWRLHRQYSKNIADKQLDIDRLEKKNDQLLTRLTKLLDRKHGLKNPPTR